MANITTDNTGRTFTKKIGYFITILKHLKKIKTIIKIKLKLNPTLRPQIFSMDNFLILSNG